MSKAFTRDDAPTEDVEPDEPSTSRAAYITKAGFLRLEKELETLWKVERPKVTHEVAVAAAQGDRSENAEYIYGKKRLREIDRRVRFLSKRLDVLNIVEPNPSQLGRVYFGAWVETEDDEGLSHTVRILGPDETDAEQGWISVDSPWARALLGKQVGDEAHVKRPKGTVTLVITSIRYEGVGERA